MQHLTTRRVVRIATIAALYAVITLAIAPFAYGPIQLRVSEALKVFVLFDPWLSLGIGIGTFFANLASGYGMWDLTFMPLTDIAGGVLAWAVYRHVLRRTLPAIAMALYAITTALSVTFMLTVLGVNAFLVLLIPLLVSELIVLVLGTPLMLWINTQLKLRGVEMEPRNM